MFVYVFVFILIAVSSAVNSVYAQFHARKLLKIKTVRYRLLIKIKD